MTWKQKLELAGKLAAFGVAGGFLAFIYGYCMIG